METTGGADMISTCPSFSLDQLPDSETVALETCSEIEPTIDVVPVPDVAPLVEPLVAPTVEPELRHVAGMRSPKLRRLSGEPNRATSRSDPADSNLTSMDEEPSLLQLARVQTLNKALAMGTGDEEESYNTNSKLQATLSKMPLSAVKDALKIVTLSFEGGRPVVVADLGCSAGPNTINNVSFIVKQLRDRLATKDGEFQAFFNDLPSNDFNNLFQLLSKDSAAKHFYSAIVPGSYFNRLFAQSSVHVFFAANCLHWVSKIPGAVLDKECHTYNRGSSWLVHSNLAVARSYKEQASADLKRFLLARGAELVSGGVLFFYCLGRSTSEPNEPTNCSMHELQVDFDEVWSGLIRNRLVTEGQRDDYNIPVYLRSIEDVREAIAGCTSMFDVLTAELQPIDVNFTELYGTSESTTLSGKIAALWKGLFNSILKLRLQKEGSEIFWYRLKKLYDNRIRMSTTAPKFTGQLCIVSLIRK